MKEELSIYRIMKLMSRKKVNFGLCILVSIVRALFYGGVFAYEVKTILQGIEMQDKGLIYCCMIQLLAAVFVVAMMNVLYTRLKTNCENRIVADIEDELMKELNQYYIAQDRKTKLTVLQNTVSNVVALGIEYVYGMVYLIFILFVSIIYGMTINKWIVSIGMVISGILVFATTRFGENLSIITKQSEMATNDVYGKLWEINDNMEILPFLNKENTYQHLDEAIKKESRLRVESSRLMNLSRILMRFSHVGAVLFTGLMGGVFVYWGELSSADLMGIILLLPLVSDNLFQIPAKINEYYSINGMCDLICNFITQDDINITAPDQMNPMCIKKIEIDKLSYKINEQKQININKICFEIGKVYGVYGESGAGKTTFLKILVKLIPEYEGSIRVNGEELVSMNFMSWWNQITYLEQESVIIPGTILDNILLDRDFDFVKKAIHFAMLDEFISVRGNKDEEISFDSVSSGEKQQICLARIYCQSKQLIIMDEATNALSPKNEDMIMKHIVDWVKRENKLLILVSHSEQVLSRCDELISF